MREQMEEVPHVKSVIWYDSLADISIPMEMLPDEIYDFFNNDEKDSTLLAVLYDTSMSADETMDAIEELSLPKNPPSPEKAVDWTISQIAKQVPMSAETRKAYKRAFMMSLHDNGKAQGKK